MLEGLNLVPWSKFQRSKLSTYVCIHEQNFSVFPQQNNTGRFGAENLPHLDLFHPWCHDI